MINILSDSNTTRQAPSFILQSSFLNKNNTDSLLHKRFESSQLGDLLSKKVKTGSTTISESTSCQDSPTLRKNKSNFSDDSCMNEEKPFKDNLESVKQILSKSRATPMSPTSTSTYSVSPDQQSMQQQEELGGSPTRSDFSSRGLLRPVDEEFCQLQQALQILQRKLNLYQEIQLLRENERELSFIEEPLYIPPLITESAEPAKVYVKESKQAKRKVKKDDENELQLSYGPVEFPFLSLSTPMPEPAAFDFLQFLQIPSLSKQQSKESEEVKSLLSNLDKESKEMSQKSEVLVKPELKRSESEGQAVVKGKKSVKVIGNPRQSGKERSMVLMKEEKMIQKKNKEIQKEQERDIEREKEKAKKVKQESEDLYARPTYLSRRQTERKKNKWQIEQEEKFKGIQFQPPIMKESSDIFFGGIKKKSAITPVGPEYQVDVPMVMIQRKLAPLRKPQMKWNPSSHDSNKLAKFFASVKKMFNMNVSEEGVIDVIVNNGNDLDRALEYLKAHKGECRKMLAVKAVMEM